MTGRPRRAADRAGAPLPQARVVLHTVPPRWWTAADGEGRFLLGDVSGGAWEVAARYSMVDLTDGTVTGGVVRDLTAGVNWYASATSKVQLNWIHSKVEDVGNADIWILRYQFAIQ